MKRLAFPKRSASWRGAAALLRASTCAAALTAIALITSVVHAQQPAAAQQQPPPPPTRQDDQGFRFKSGVELINVTATVSDASGRFVSGLNQDDFLVYEDDRPVSVTHFSAERVPVSLGIALDTSGSMAGSKIQAAQDALDRFLYELLDKEDEIFLYRFSNVPMLLQGWTRDRQLLSRALGRITPNGGTAMYDAVADAIPLAQQGQHRKKALLLISDGNDTASATTIREVKTRIRESEVLVYAIGIDGEGESTTRAPAPMPPRQPFPTPFPFPGGRGGRRPGTFPPIGGGGGGTGGGGWGRTRVNPDDRVNVAALRDMTDDSGGRTEIIRNPRDLDPSTANIADELSKQYYLGYQAAGTKDGRWHSIRVEVKNHSYRVRARRGYVAS
ncbi:MAG TPA: VWA domain-containing protein [Vicinamibacterales bacterium]|nr:VWA domain-containing protein [Vicinamibacterales bacterium]